MDSELIEYIEDDIIDYFNINDKVDIIKTYANDETIYTTYIKDVYDDKFVIDYLSKNGERIPLREEAEVRIALYSKDGVFEASTITSQIIRDGKTGVVVYIPEWLEKTQRRAFMRWQTMFPVTLYNMNGNLVIEKMETSSFDISGAGLALKTKEAPFKNWSSIVAEFEFEDLKIKTPVKFVQAHYILSEQQYKVGLQFYQFDSQQTNDLHKAIIKQQLDYRRKGII